MSSNQESPPNETGFAVLTHDARRLVAVIALSSLLAGCTNQVAGAPIGTGQIVDSNPTADPGPTGSSTPAAPPSEADPDIPKAKDGSDITACYDGTCEVELRAPVTIPFDPATGMVSLTLDRVDQENGAQLTGTASTGSSVSASLAASPGFVATTVFDNVFMIQALATVDGVAVLRFGPA
jgi:hypothetical protein